MSFCYLPNISNDAIDKIVCEQDDSLVESEIQRQKYERIGLDRLFLILKDICLNFGKCSGFSFLDVGCNNGLLSNFICEYGNKMVGIDNYAINNQKRYDELNFMNSNCAQLKQIDIYDFLRENEECFDFVLLLSVAHQWEYGYAHTGEYLKEKDEIEYIMNTLLDRTQKAIYYECPIDEPGFAKNYGISFLKKNVKEYNDLSIVKIADTVASNGYIRELYRINKTSKPTVSEGTGLNFNKISMFKQRNNLHGEIVLNGEKIKNNYIIYNRSGTIILPLDNNYRTEIHPMGKQPLIQNKIVLWEKIKKKKSNYIEKIFNIYSEGYAEVEIVDGLTVMNLFDTPYWYKQRILNVSTEPSISFCKIAQLCRGLGDLHSMGIAHGDPYPYNAVITDKDAKWIDLGNITEGKDEIKKDIHVFFLYSFPFMLQKMDLISYQMLESLCELFKSAQNVDKVMLDAADIIENVTDSRKLVTTDIPFLFESVGRIIENDKKNKNRYQIFYQAYKYHSDFIIWMNNSALYKNIEYFNSMAQKYSEIENRRMRLSIDIRENELKKEQRNLELKNNQLLKEIDELKKEQQSLELKNNQLLNKIKNYDGLLSYGNAN